MLQYLQDIQLGLCNDVYAAVFCEEKLYVEFAGIVSCIANPLGINIFHASWKVFGEHKWLFAVQELFWKALCSQKTVNFIMETDWKILFRTNKETEEINVLFPICRSVAENNNGLPDYP